MPELDDNELLAQYLRGDSEEAFATLVSRHVNLVYSVALRQTGNPHAAEEITQAVFIILAKKARELCGRTVLSGWLYQTARLTAANYLRTEFRRARREQEAHMQSLLNEPHADDAWQQIAPQLDEAMGRLGEIDRNAIVLRYFESKSLKDVGAALGASEDAAKMRVNRALEKLRKIFGKRGVTLTATLIAGAVSANSVQAAPVGLAATVVTTAAKGNAIAASMAALVKGTMHTMTWLELKFGIGIGTVALAAGTAIVAVLPEHTPSASALIASQPSAVTVPVAATPVVVREPLTDSTKFTLTSPPGAVAVQPDGKILVASTLFGAFLDEKTGSLGFYTRGAFRLNSDGSLDRSFLCDVGRHDSAAQMAHVDVATGGRIFMSGAFDAVNDKPRPGYAMLLPDGNIDESFEPWRGSTNVSPRTHLPGGTYPGTWLSDGSVAIMSGSVEGSRAPYPLTVYRLDSEGRWIAPTTDVLASEFLRPSGLILTLGEIGFWARRPVEWTRNTPNPTGPVGDLPFDRHPGLPTAFDAAKVLQALFEEVPIELCRYAVRLTNSATVLSVQDKLIDGSMTPLGRFMRFDKNWKPDFSFTNQFVVDRRSRLTLKRQKDGKLLVGGLVGKMNGEDSSGVVRLLENGQVDRSFRCEITNTLEGRVMDLAIQEDGRILICGFFSNVNGVEVPHIARLNPDGSLDPTFRTPFMTWAQFNNDRFSKARRVPVARISKATAATPEKNLAPNIADASPQTILITSMRLFGDTAMIEFTGTANQQYILQAKDSLNDGDWINLSTNRASITGAGMFRDGETSKHPMRFYRVASP